MEVFVLASDREKNTIKLETKNNKKTSNHNLKRILKEYKDLLIKVNNEPNINNLIILKVSNINDLIEVAFQNNSHIIYYKTTNQNNK